LQTLSGSVLVKIKIQSKIVEEKLLLDLLEGGIFKWSIVLKIFEQEKINKWLYSNKLI
jgi:hypothetical protein